MPKAKFSKKDRLEAAKEAHAGFLKSVGYRGDGSGSKYRAPIPSYKVEQNIAPTSDNMSYYPSAPKRAPEGAKEFTIAPAYNKGPAMVITRDNVKDIGR